MICFFKKEQDQFYTVSLTDPFMKHSSALFNHVLQSIQNRLVKKLRSYFQRLLSVAVFIFLYCIPGAQVVYAQWSPNSAVYVASGGQHPGMISDGAGGSIIAWYTGSSVGAQRINAAGIAQWTTTIGSGFGQQVPVSIISDGAGGAIITWIGGISIIVQRVNASGVLQWATGGVTICAASNSSFDPSIASDGSGGAIIAWFDHRNGIGIYAQHVDATGATQWPANGIAIYNGNIIEPSNEYGPPIVSDDAGGAIIGWRDNRSGNADIYAQRINSFGAALWASAGIAICAFAGNQDQPAMISYGANGAVIVWIDNRNGNNDIYGQCITAAGIAQWTANGIGICTWGGQDVSPIMVNDKQGGTIVAWGRSNGVYAQKINSLGELQWTGGTPVAATTTSGVVVPAITDDGADGAIITWMDIRSGTNYDIYAQRILASGIVPWTFNGIAICTTPGSQGYPVILNNGSNGAFISWNNSPPGGIYVENINDDGTIGPAAALLNSCPAGNTSITSNLTGATYQWQVNTGSGFVNVSDNSNYSGANLVSLQINNIPSAWYGYIYRCIVNGAYSKNSKLKFSDNWIGAANSNWENMSNWSCGTVPDANTDVVITSGTVVVNVNTTIRTLTLAPGINFTVAPGVILTITH
jgi:hypothetical protein